MAVASQLFTIKARNTPRGKVCLCETQSLSRLVPQPECPDKTGLMKDVAFHLRPPCKSCMEPAVGLEPTTC